MDVFEWDGLNSHNPLLSCTSREFVGTPEELAKAYAEKKEKDKQNKSWWGKEKRASRTPKEIERAERTDEEKEVDLAWDRAIRAHLSIRKASTERSPSLTSLVYLIRELRRTAHPRALTKCDRCNRITLFGRRRRVASSSIRNSQHARGGDGFVEFEKDVSGQGVRMHA